MVLLRAVLMCLPENKTEGQVAEMVNAMLDDLRVQSSAATVPSSIISNIRSI